MTELLKHRAGCRGEVPARVEQCVDFAVRQDRAVQYLEGAVADLFSGGNCRQGGPAQPDCRASERDSVPKSRELRFPGHEFPGF
nr:hypothetical protein [Nesterenkonia ebinurensis]